MNHFIWNVFHVDDNKFKICWKSFHNELKDSANIRSIDRVIWPYYMGHKVKLTQIIWVWRVIRVKLKSEGPYGTGDLNEK